MDPIYNKVICPGCGARYKVKPQNYIKKYKCKKCNSTIVLNPIEYNENQKDNFINELYEIYLAHKEIIDTLNDVLNMFKFSIYIYLSPKYISSYGDNYGNLLATSISNELFSLPPSKKIGKKFLKENRDTILKEIRDLKYDDHFCDLISKAINIYVVVNYKPINSNDPELLLLSHEKAQKPIQKLKELGLYHHTGDTIINDKVIKELTFFTQQQMNSIKKA